MNVKIPTMCHSKRDGAGHNLSLFLFNVFFFVLLFGIAFFVRQKVLQAEKGNRKTNFFGRTNTESVSQKRRHNDHQGQVVERKRGRKRERERRVEEGKIIKTNSSKKTNRNKHNQTLTEQERIPQEKKGLKSLGV